MLCLCLRGNTPYAHAVSVVKYQDKREAGRRFYNPAVSMNRRSSTSVAPVPFPQTSRFKENPLKSGDKQFPYEAAKDEHRMRLVC